MKMTTMTILSFTFQKRLFVSFFLLFCILESIAQPVPNIITGGDDVRIIEVSDTYRQGEAPYIKVKYKALKKRLITISLWKKNKWLAGNRAIVEKGEGELVFHVKNLKGKLTLGNDYAWKVHIIPHNRNWQDALQRIQMDKISVIAKDAAYQSKQISFVNSEYSLQYQKSFSLGVKLSKEMSGNNYLSVEVREMNTQNLIAMGDTQLKSGELMMNVPMVFFAKPLKNTLYRLTACVQNVENDYEVMSSIVKQVHFNIEEKGVKQNLVVNGGFESGKLFPWKASKGKVDIHPSTGRGLGAKTGFVPYNSRILQVVKIKPNTEYELKADVRTVGGEVFLGVEDFGGADRQVGIKNLRFMSYAVRFKSGENNHTAKVFLHAVKRSHGAHLDNVVLKEIDVDNIDEQNLGSKYSRDVIFEKYTSREGLSQNNLNAIHQDKFGLMWFGTNDGLNRFDGYDFKVYKPDPENPESIASNLIYDIAEDKSANIWMRTIGGGVIRFDRATEKFHSFYHDTNSPETLRGGVIKYVNVDNEDRLWVATKEGLSYMQLTGETLKDTVQHFIHIKLPKKNDFVTCIYPAKDGRLIMGSQRGFLYEIRKGKLKGENTDIRIHELKVIKNIPIFSITETEEGKLIVGTGWGGAYQVRGGVDWAFVPLNIDSTVKGLACDKNGNLWASSTMSGLYQFNLNTKNGLPELINIYQNNADDNRTLNENEVISLGVDNKGIVWVGTGKGLNKLNPYRVPFLSFSKNTNINSLSDYKVRAIYEDSFGGLWVGTQGRGFLNYKAPKTEEDNYNTFVSLPISSVDAIHETEVDGKKVLVIGTGKGKNLILELDDFTGAHPMEIMNRTTLIKSLEGASVTSIVEDKHNQIWCISYNMGLFKWSADPKDSLSNAPLNYLRKANGGYEAFGRSLHLDKKGNLWVATSKGVRKILVEDLQKKSFDMELFTHEPDNPNSLSIDYVTVLSEDNQGNIWAGTLGGGLNKMVFDRDGKLAKVDRLTENGNGLANNVVRGIGVDNHNNMWVATNQGISKVNVETLDIKNYDVDDGLQDNQFMDLSVYKSKTGEFYMGGVTGVNVFHPDSIYNKTSKPDILFTDLLIDNKVITAGEEVNGRVVLNQSIVETDGILLTHKEKSFTVKFAAIHYAAPLKNQFKYKLEGFDKDWIPMDASIRAANYTNLPVGEYTLKVKASNNDNLWNEEGITLKVTVIPPWWETWWFRVLVLLSIAAIIFSYYKYRTNMLKKRQQELETLVDERTSQLQSAHQDLQMKHEEVQTQAEELVQQSEELQTQRDHLERNNKVIVEKSNLIEMLSEIGREITSSIEVHNIVETIYTNLNKLLNVEYFEIGVLDNKFSRVSFYGFHESDTMIKNNSDIRILDNRLLTFSQWVFLHRKSIVINNIDTDLDKHPLINKDKYLGQKYKSIIYYPLIVGENLVGIMVLKSIKQAAFDSNTLSILESITDYASISIENARTYNVIQETTEQMTSSIRYAQTIQEAMLPFDEAFKQQFDSYFTLFRPKDIVSGDFYWMSEHEDRVFVAAVDCTGHGVPGAFMSMIGSSILNRIVKEQKVYETDKILDLLDTGIRKALKQDQSKNDDGMDLVLCCFHKNNEGIVNKVSFTGAKNSLYYYSAQDSELREIKGDRRAIGGAVQRKSRAFTCQEVEVSRGDTVYLLTDGILDQNKADRTRFGKVRLQKILSENSQLVMSEQFENIAKELEGFQGEEEQRDDITLIGIKI